MRLAFAPYTLKFRNPAGTSRGVLLEKPTWLIKLWDEKDPTRFGIGEAALFPGLSAEDNDRYIYKLIELLANVAIGKPTDLSRHSSIQFGFEQAIQDFASGARGLYYPSPFTEGQQEITINGLIWMGSEEEMQARIEEKFEQGFRCIKMKIGAIDWQKEVRLLEWMRSRYSADQLTIRVDANGAFSMENALPRLARLASLGVHSIEQPIPAGHPDLMAFLCQVSPTPIALDEELIGVVGRENKEALLDTIRPAYIILKPSLCGGFSGAEEWIDLAEEKGIGWWVTSALESNVGLNAIAQWTAKILTESAGKKSSENSERSENSENSEYSEIMMLPQGLGTGALYTNNFTSPLRLEGDLLSYNPAAPIDRRQFADLPWRE